MSARSAVVSRCAITMTVRPAISRSSARSSSSSVPGSRLDVASSSTSTDGSMSPARATDTSCRSPAEKFVPARLDRACRDPQGSASNRAVSPRSSSAARTRASSASGDAMSRFSRIVPVKRKPSWGMTTIRFRSVASSTLRRSTPPKLIVASRRVVEARHQLGECRLSGTGGADEHEPLPVLERERHVAQHRTSCGAYRKLHVVDNQIAGRPGARPAASGSSEVERSSSNPYSFFSAAPACWKRVEHLRELLDRLEQVVEVEHERGDDADGHVALRTRSTRRAR